MDPYIGEIRMFAGNFAPKDWALCNGQLLAISQNTALFAILGTAYGGDGRTTFALPNFQGAVPISQGQGPGLTDRTLGETGGAAAVTLITAELAAHSHGFQGAEALGTATTPTNNDVASNRTVFAYTSPGAGPQLKPMAPQMLGPAGGNQPHNNLQPYLAVTFIICMAGVFPPRN